MLDAAGLGFADQDERVAVLDILSGAGMEEVEAAGILVPWLERETDALDPDSKRRALLTVRTLVDDKLAGLVTAGIYGPRPDAEVRRHQLAVLRMRARTDLRSAGQAAQAIVDQGIRDGIAAELLTEEALRRAAYDETLAELESAEPGARAASARRSIRQYGLDGDVLDDELWLALGAPELDIEAAVAGDDQHRAVLLSGAMGGINGERFAAWWQGASLEERALCLPLLRAGFRPSIDALLWESVPTLGTPTLKVLRSRLAFDGEALVTLVRDHPEMFDGPILNDFLTIGFGRAPDGAMAVMAGVIDGGLLGLVSGETMRSSAGVAADSLDVWRSIAADQACTDEHRLALIQILPWLSREAGFQDVLLEILNDERVAVEIGTKLIDGLPRSFWMEKGVAFQSAAESAGLRHEFIEAIEAATKAGAGRRLPPMP